MQMRYNMKKISGNALTVKNDVVTQVMTYWNVDDVCIVVTTF